MNERQTLAQRYAIRVVPVPKTPHWYNVRFDPVSSYKDGKEISEAQTSVPSSPPAPVPDAIVVMDGIKEASFVRWNRPPAEDGIAREVYEAEACHQVTAAHQKRLAL